jgi:hypothetical protein
VYHLDRFHVNTNYNDKEGFFGIFTYINNANIYLFVLTSLYEIHGVEWNQISVLRTTK